MGWITAILASGPHFIPKYPFNSPNTMATPSSSSVCARRRRDVPGYRPDGARHPCCHPPSSGASVMRVTEIQAEPEQKRQDRPARHAEKQGRRARTPRLRSLVAAARARIREASAIPALGTPWIEVKDTSTEGTALAALPAIFRFY